MSQKEELEVTEHLLTVKGVVRMSGATSGYVRDLCREGRLDAFKLGGRWLIDKRSAEVWNKTRRPPGRPPKGKTPDSQLGLDLEKD